MIWATELRATLADRLGADVELETAFATATMTVPADRWRAAVGALRDLGFTFFDWLSAVDELADGFSIVAHLGTLLRPGDVRRLVVRTRVERAEPRVDSIVDIFAGAAWHERETHEMFGIDFAGHAGLLPLLLPDQFEGHPLRKEFVLAARVAKPWPGAKDPGESDADLAAAPTRRKVVPPGVPAAEAWGPREPGSPAPDPLAAAEPARPARKATRTPRRPRPSVNQSSDRSAGRSAEPTTGPPTGPTEDES